MSDVRETIVLIHGYGFDPRIWSPVEIAFEGFDVVYLALPGFGNDGIPAPYSIPSLAAQYLETLQLSIAGPFHLVGHSMGGYVCMEMIAQKPELVSSLVLIHSHVYADSAEKKLQRTKTADEIKASGHGPLVHKMIPSMFAEHRVPASMVDVLVERGMQYPVEAWSLGAMAMRDRFDRAETLKQMTVPVMIIAGESDTAVPVDLAYRMASVAERCLLRVYPDCGHLSMYESTLPLIGDLMSFFGSFRR